MYPLTAFLFSIIAFVAAFFHYSWKNKLVKADELEVVSGKVSQIMVNDFGRNASVTIKLSELPENLFITDRYAAFATAEKSNLERDIKIGDPVSLSVKSTQDSGEFLGTKFFYQLQTDQKRYLTLENYNRYFQRYQSGNLRLWLFGGILCLVVGVSLLIF